MTHSDLQLAPLLQRINTVNPGFNTERVLEAYEYAQSLYQGHIHWTGVSVLQHVFRVLETLSPFEPDEDAIVATLLHHVLLVEGGSLREVEERFGPSVRAMVGGIHMLSGVTLAGRRQSIEDMRLMLLSVSDDIRTILVSLCDRCAVLKDIGGVDRSEAQQAASDVLNLFAPVAARLGIYTLKHEMERLAFPVCYASDAERIHEQLQELHSRAGDFLPVVSEKLITQLQERGFDPTVEYRQKQAFSIFRKLRTKSMTHIEDLKDLFAIRVIVDSVEECYQVLGLLHQIGRPVTGRFKDFIAFPKPNGYQSLHTTVAQLSGVPKDTFIEVQVRTKKMHREAKFGVAAHWSYKEYGSTARALEQAQLKKMLTSQEAIGEHQPTFVDHIFVLTPRGDIIELPEGATPLDFAFQVHTDLGLSFRGAMVNGSIVPMDHELENGDTVEIQKYKTPQPSPQWMQNLRMASSRSKLKRYLYAQHRTEYIAQGRELVNAELVKLSLPPLDTDLSILKIYDGTALAYARREDLLMKVGQGSERPASLFAHLTALEGKLPEKSNSVKLERTVKRGVARPSAAIHFDDGVPMPTRIAKCCKPNAQHKDRIVGLINRDGEVMIHRAVCSMLKKANKERMVGVHF